ncbi:MAG TPA: flagellar hook capping FlgD N-terminal domain-containing protein [Jatrophihabitans sp.]|jgi:flagellar basal-body rod modification protein FlgD|uniref:flagellar hook capping FlgD N-terminal domain-containing protein n=1 Tax=Jatrophihabitans sp. TaxID=1932789 RepID=UPI002E03261D|nr:flagellar hook capping FlgD N-terminal domain-containing protein [Jatrophihabitans sp.]
MTTPIPAVGTPGVAPATGPAAAKTGSSGQPMLDPQAFLQLLVAQLKYQDPSSPVDTSAFMQQTATLSQVQTMTTMSATLTALVNSQQAQSAMSLIGKDVTYTDSAGGTSSGIVSAVSTGGAGAMLTIGSASVPAGSVTEVRAAPSGTTP